MNNLYKSLSLLLTLCLVTAAFAGLTLQAAAVAVTIDIGDNGLATVSGQYTVDNGVITINPGITTVNITGNADKINKKYTIVCPGGVNKITLNDAKWTAAGGPALRLFNSGVNNITATGTNALTGGYGGICVYPGDVTISGNGNVYATGGNGGGCGIYAGNSVTISDSVNVTATGGSDGGSGIFAQGGNVNIDGGSVEANGGNGDYFGGTGIYAGSGVTIESSGSVKATGGNGTGTRGVGGNGITAGGDITINNNANVTATGGSGTGSGSSTGGGPTGGHGAVISGNLNVNITAGTVTFTGGTGRAKRGHGVADGNYEAWTTEKGHITRGSGVNMSPIAGNNGDAEPGVLKFWVEGAEPTPDDPAKPTATTTTRRKAATELSLSMKRNFDETTLTPKIRYDFTIVGPENGDTANVYVKGGTLASRSGLNFTVIPDAEAEVVEITISANGYKQLTIEYDIAAAPQNSEPMPDDDVDNFNPGTGV